MWFLSFLRAISHALRKAEGAQLRRMRVHRFINLTLDDLARSLKPIMRGWMQYYGRSHRSEMRSGLRRVSTYLSR